MLKISDFISSRPPAVAFGHRRGADSFKIERDSTSYSLVAQSGAATDLPIATSSAAGVLAAADKDKLDRLEESLLCDAVNFRSRTDVEAAVVDAEVTALRIAGWASPEDGGRARFKRLSEEPAHSLWIRSLDGAYWELETDNGAIPFQACGGIAGDDTANGAANVTAFDNFIGYAQQHTSGNIGTSYVVGPTLLFPRGEYHFNTPLNVKAAVRLLGVGVADAAALWEGSVLKFPADSHGIIVQRSDTIDQTTEASTFAGDGTIIEGLGLIGGGNTGTTGHGINLRARALVRDVAVRDFAEHGFNINAQASGSGSVKGNANLFALERCHATRNGLSGLYIAGADANAGYTLLFNAINNGRWGIFETSFLGNTHNFPHASGNGLANSGGNATSGVTSAVHYDGKVYAASLRATEADLVATTPGTDPSVWIEYDPSSVASAGRPDWVAAQPEGTYVHGGSYGQDQNIGALWLRPYEESFQAPAQIRSGEIIQPTFPVGNKGEGLSLKQSDTTGSISFSNDKTWFTDSPARELVARINNATQQVFAVSAEGDTANGMVWGWDESRGTYYLGNTSTKDLRFLSNLNTTIKCGRGTAPRQAFAWLQGFFLGARGQLGGCRFIGFDNAAPAAGEYGKGDTYFNNNPTQDGSLAGWRIKTAGTMGSGAALHEFYYVPELPANRGKVLRPKTGSTKEVEWRDAPKAGSATISDGASIIAVAFTTTATSGNYAVAVSTDGDESVWVSGKSANGFTINRAGTTGARDVDWTVTQHENL